MNPMQIICGALLFIMLGPITFGGWLYFERTIPDFGDPTKVSPFPFALGAFAGTGLWVIGLAVFAERILR